MDDRRLPAVAISRNASTSSSFIYLVSLDMVYPGLLSFRCSWKAEFALLCSCLGLIVVRPSLCVLLR